MVEPGRAVRAGVVSNKKRTILGSAEGAAQHRTLQGVVNQTTIAMSNNHETVSVEKQSETRVYVNTVLI